MFAASKARAQKHKAVGVVSRHLAGAIEHAAMAHPLLGQTQFVADAAKRRQRRIVNGVRGGKTQRVDAGAACAIST